MSQFQHVILLGPPGSGKGTQAKKIAHEMGYIHLSTGDLIREQIKSSTALGKKIKNIVDSGEFPKDDIILQLVYSFMKENASGVIFDGFPRTLFQAKEFMSMFSTLENALICAILIDVPRHTVIDRLIKRYMCEKCGAIYSDSIPLKEEGVCNNCQSTSFTRREDDKNDLVEKRLSVYCMQTEPIVKFLSEKMPFLGVNGVQNPEKVTLDILRFLNN